MSTATLTAGPRTTGVLTWDETFMQIAQVIRQRSKDPSTQVGAVIVAPDNRVLSLGYNGTPNGFDDAHFPWAREADSPADTKYPYIIHAERNAVLNFRGLTREMEGATLYATHFPCNECAKEIIQAGIRTVVYATRDTGMNLLEEVTERMFRECGVTARLHSTEIAEVSP